MTGFFKESTDMGKLYINYPMVEAFYHMKNIPDPDYDSYTATMSELQGGDYKTRVHNVTRGSDYRKFAVNKAECDTVIWQNINKARMLVGLGAANSATDIPDHHRILESQINKMKNEQAIAVLCTCSFYIVDYNPALLGELSDSI